MPEGPLAPGIGKRPQNGPGVAVPQHRPDPLDRTELGLAAGRVVGEPAEDRRLEDTATPRGPAARQYEPEAG
jgi:hypothetical protein